MNQARYQFESALSLAGSTDYSSAEKATVMLEVALGIADRATQIEDYDLTIQLLESALSLPDLDLEQRAVLQLQLASSLFHHGEEGIESLQVIAERLKSATRAQDAETRSDAYMLRGLVLQTMAIEHQADYRAAVDSYDEALKYFTAANFPVEYSIIQNNLATLWLSLKDAGISAHSFEALAVGAFETALSCISADKNPEEFAMLSNNLGNALQHADDEHALANNLRAREAYDVALDIRRKSNNAAALANTLANRANCVGKLPDELSQPEGGNRSNLREAIANASEALDIYQQLGDFGRGQIMRSLIADLNAELNREEGYAQHA